MCLEGGGHNVETDLQSEHACAALKKVTSRAGVSVSQPGAEDGRPGGKIVVGDFSR